KLRTRSWEKHNVTRYTTEIVGDNMVMLSPKSSGGGTSDYSPSSANSGPTGSPDYNPSDQSDDLPF
ncbi:MAG TPA: single-stranded DNA-binding protein, partial [Cyclobacteriaceae bacterium]|nr:single-stranded DNA-binding protein [Cyclobacteriaceae bacterium]